MGNNKSIKELLNKFKKLFINMQSKLEEHQRVKQIKDLVKYLQKKGKTLSEEEIIKIILKIAKNCRGTNEIENAIVQIKSSNRISDDSLRNAIIEIMRASENPKIAGIEEPEATGAIQVMTNSGIGTPKNSEELKELLKILAKLPIDFDKEIAVLKKIGDTVEKQKAIEDLLKRIYASDIFKQSSKNYKIDNDLCEILQQIIETSDSKEGNVMSYLEKIIAKKMAYNIAYSGSTFLYSFSKIIEPDRMINDNLIKKVKHEIEEVKNKKYAFNEKELLRSMIQEVVTQQILKNHLKGEEYSVPNLQGLSKNDRRYLVKQIEILDSTLNNPQCTENKSRESQKILINMLLGKPEYSEDTLSKKEKRILKNLLIQKDKNVSNGEDKLNLQQKQILEYLKKKRNNKISRKQRLLILRQLRKITETEQKAKEDEHLNK